MQVETPLLMWARKYTNCENVMISRDSMEGPSHKKGGRTRITHRSLPLSDSEQRPRLLIADWWEGYVQLATCCSVQYSHVCAPVSRIRWLHHGYSLLVMIDDPNHSIGYTSCQSTRHYSFSQYAMSVINLNIKTSGKETRNVLEGAYFCCYTGSKRDAQRGCTIA